MSSSDDEGSVWGPGFNPPGRGRVRGRAPHPIAPRGLRLGLDLGPLLWRSGVFESPSQSEGMAAEGRVLWGLEGRPGSLANVQGPALHLAEEGATGVLQQLSHRAALGVRRNPSPESCATEVRAAWADVEPGPRGRGVRGQRWVGPQPLTSAATALHPREPKGGWVWRGLPKRGAKGKSAGTGSVRRRSVETLTRLASDSESSDEIHVEQLMTVATSAKPRSPEGPGDTPRHPSTHVEEGVLHVPRLFLPCSPPGVTSAVGELEASSSENALQEKRSLSRSSTLASGNLPSWRQRVPALPAAEPVTLPAVSAVPLLTTSKQTSAEKKSVAWESEPMAEEDNDGKGDQVPKGQVYGREFSSGDFNVRVPLVPRCPQLLVLSQEDDLPRGGPTALGDQELLHHRRPGLERRRQRQQLPPGIEGCPRCPVLQREVDKLKEELAAMQTLTDKFYI